MTKTRLFLHYRRGAIILAHSFAFAAAYWLSYLLRFDFHIPRIEMIGFYAGLVPVMMLQLMSFGYFGLFSGLWIYFGTKDVFQILKANTVASVLFVVTVKFLGWNSFPRSVFLLDLILAVAFTSAIRFFVKYLKESINLRRIPAREHNLLIVGAGETGCILLNEIRRKPNMGRVIGFIDDDRAKQFEAVQGCKIFGRRQDIPKVVEEHGVDEIILAIPSADGETVRDVLSYCEKTKAKIRVVPGLHKIISGEMEVRAREVRPDDLLGRETVEIDEENVRSYIKGKVVLVTGAGGSIGSEICRQVAAYGPREILLFDHHENLVYFLAVEFRQRYPALKVRTVIGDIRDVGLLKHVFSRTRPQVVFHAAAHKHVPLMEDSPVAAVKNNIFGTRNMIYASAHYGVERFVQISTDKAVNPVNVMGMSKRVAEMVLQAKAARSRTRFMAVRFGNVLGSAGSVVPLFKQQIENGGPLTVTHRDVKRYFMSIKEAVMLVLQAGAMGKGGELFILDMGEQIKVMEIAKNLIALSGLTLGKDIEIKITGLRQGEKLEEELLLDKEKDATTAHNKIFISRSGMLFSKTKMRQGLKRLHRLTEVMDEEAILRLLKAITGLGNGAESFLADHEFYVSKNDKGRSKLRFIVRPEEDRKP